MNALTHRRGAALTLHHGGPEYESDGKLLKSGSNVLPMHYGNKSIACQQNIEKPCDINTLGNKVTVTGLARCYRVTA